MISWTKDHNISADALALGITTGLFLLRTLTQV